MKDEICVADLSQRFVPSQGMELGIGAEDGGLLLGVDEAVASSLRERGNEGDG
jgi:hypothetical protein